jgi:hypothetical protein
MRTLAGSQPRKIVSERAHSDRKRNIGMHHPLLLPVRDRQTTGLAGHGPAASDEKVVVAREPAASEL